MRDLVTARCPQKFVKDGSAVQMRPSQNLVSERSSLAADSYTSTSTSTANGGMQPGTGGCSGSAEHCAHQSGLASAASARTSCRCEMHSEHILC